MVHPQATFMHVSTDMLQESRMFKQSENKPSTPKQSGIHKSREVPAADQVDSPEEDVSIDDLRQGEFEYITDTGNGKVVVHSCQSASNLN